MKLINILLAFDLVSQSDARTTMLSNNAEQKFKQLNQNYPKMLEMYFENNDDAIKRKVNKCSVEITKNLTIFKGAVRIARRFKNNFANKNHIIYRLLNRSCPEDAVNNIIEVTDLENFGRFDYENPRAAFSQTANGYKQLLDAMRKSECKNKAKPKSLVSFGLLLENSKM